jgi:hypothetical protein
VGAEIIQIVQLAKQDRRLVASLSVLDERDEIELCFITSGPFPRSAKHRAALRSSKTWKRIHRANDIDLRWTHPLALKPNSLRW